MSVHRFCKLHQFSRYSHKVLLISNPSVLIKMSSTHFNDGHENWPHALFACCEYTDDDEPVECPSRMLHLCFPCLLLGRTYSILENEEENCCCLKVGYRGFCCCGFSALLNCCIPVCPISPFFALGVVYQRSRIMDKFNIHGGCSEAIKGCCCTCSVYQQYNFANEFKIRKLQRSGVSFDSNTTVSNKTSFNRSIDRTIRV